MRKWFLLFTIAVFSLSCKKEDVNPIQLEGDYAWAVGKWEWRYTIMEYNCGFPPHPVDTVRFEDLNSTYSIELLEEGRFRRYRNDILISDHIISDLIGDTYSLFFYLDGNTELSATVVNFQTYISHGGFPVHSADCHAVKNRFEKQ